MRDRKPTKPNRVLITPESDSTPFYATMTRADEPEDTGTPLNVNTLLKDATAAKFGLTGDSAIPDKAFEFVATYVLAGGITSVTVLTEDGDPIPGVFLSGVVSQDGGEVSTDANGRAVCVVTSDVDVTFVSPYVDIPNIVETLTPNYVSANTITIVMPYIVAGTLVTLELSQTVKTFRDRSVSAALVGGGTGGQGGQGGMSSGAGNTTNSNGMYGRGGSGGAGGKVYNFTLTTTAEEEYTLVVGAGGTGGSRSAVSTSYDKDTGENESEPGKAGSAGGDSTLTSENGTAYSSASGKNSTIALSNSSLVIGGAGGTGGNGGRGYNSDYNLPTNGTAGTRAGGYGGNGGSRSSNGVVASQWGKDGGIGGGGGGGGGGGTGVTYSTARLGGDGGNGGHGALLLQF